MNYLQYQCNKVAIWLMTQGGENAPFVTLSGPACVKAVTISDR